MRAIWGSFFNAKWVILCCLVIELAPVVRSSDAVQFTAAQLCPTSGESPAAVGISGRLQCAATCARKPQCSAFYLRISDGACFNEDTCINNWPTGPCDAFKVAGGGTSDKNSWLKELQMLAFYDFRRSDSPMVNQADSRHLCLRAANITFDGVNGARFYGNRKSFMYMGTPGFESVINNGDTYSFYIMVRHMANSGNTYYHRVQQCEGTGAANVFGRSSRHIYNYALWTMYVKADSQDLLPSSSQLPILISTGLTYNSTQLANFYFNGTAYPIDSNADQSNIVTPDNYECLYIGLSKSDDTKCLNGTLRCYGISRKVLSESDFRQLESACLADV